MWDCEAYGPEGKQFGALCFLGEAGERVCADQQACHEAMAAERHQAFARIHELADRGDQAAIYLAEAFTSPDQLLGGSDSGTDDVDVDTVKAELRAMLLPGPSPLDSMEDEQRWKRFKRMAARIESDPILRAELAREAAEIKAELAKNFPPEGQ